MFQPFRKPRLTSEIRTPISNLTRIPYHMSSTNWTSFRHNKFLFLACTLLKNDRLNRRNNFPCLYQPYVIALPKIMQ